MAGRAMRTWTWWRTVFGGRAANRLRPFGIGQPTFEIQDPARGEERADSNASPAATWPNFVLPRVGGGDRSLSDYLGREVLLVFVQSGCPRSETIATHLNRHHQQPVLAIHLGSPRDAALWADNVLATFPVLATSGPDVAQEFGVSDSPFAIVIDEQGRIARSGIISCPEGRRLEPGTRQRVPHPRDLGRAFRATCRMLFDRARRAAEAPATPAAH